MARYRKVDTRIWNDAKFARLGYARLAFLFLLTHPHQTSIGAMRATVGGLADEIGWSREAFAGALGALERADMLRVDPLAHLVWLPNFLKYNGPENPNVAKGFATAFASLPESPLRAQVGQAVEAACSASDAMLDAFWAGMAAEFGADARAMLNPSGTVSEGVGNGFGTVAGPSRNPEPEPEPLPEPDPHTHTAPEADPPADDATARARAVDPSDDRPRPTGARPASNTGISTAGASWGAIPTRNRKAHCAYESAIGLDVPAVLHSELLAKACNAYPEMAPRDVEAWLLEWYAQTDAAYVGQAVGDDAFRFRRARFRETFGTTVREAPAKVAGLTGGGVTPRPRREADDNVWGRVLARLESQVNRHTFASWLRDTRLASDTGDRLTIAVPDPTVGDWIARNYPTQIAAALRDLGREDVALAFTTEDTTR